MERDEIESSLEELGTRVEYPETPDLAHAVRRRLEEDTGEQPSRHRRIRLTFPPRWAVAAAALMLVVSLPLLSQGARDTLSGVFVGAGSSGSAASGGAASESAAPEGAQEQAAGGVSGNSTTSDQRQGGVSVSEASPGASSEGEEAVTGVSEEFGAALTLERARDRLDGRLLLPRALSLGEPEEVYLLGDPSGEGVAIVYLQRPGISSLGETGAGLALIEIPGDLRSMYPDGPPVASSVSEEIRVGGDRGYWITGEEKLPPPLDPDVYPPANVLLWEQGGLVLRLETELPKGEAIRLAESVR